MNKQLSYYKENNINPVMIESQGDKWIKHLNARNNLYENHIRLPLSWFNGKKILEFGPNGGENSLILAMYGAQICLVEPHTMMHERIHALFDEADCNKSLTTINARKLEDYEDDSLYDLVIAEGFIHALPDRKEIIRKLCSFSNDFIIFTYNEKPGWFFESMKRAVFKRVLELFQFTVDQWDETLAVAENLFYKNFQKLGSARTFDSWVKDILINPVATSDMFDSLDDFMLVFEEMGCEYHSGSPAWDLRHAHKWYKDLDRGEVIDEYYRNIPFFINCNKYEKITEGCIADINSITEKFLDYSSGLIDFREIECLPRLDPSEWNYAGQVNELLNILLSKKADKIISYFVHSSLCEMWGMPQHYVCVRKAILNKKMLTKISNRK